jgi:hypothetical protein
MPKMSPCSVYNSTCTPSSSSAGCKTYPSFPSSALLTNKIFDICTSMNMVGCELCPIKSAKQVNIIFGFIEKAQNVFFYCRDTPNAICWACMANSAVQCLTWISAIRIKLCAPCRVLVWINRFLFPFVLTLALRLRLRTLLVRPITDLWCKCNLHLFIYHLSSVS